MFSHCMVGLSGTWWASLLAFPLQNSTDAVAQIRLHLTGWWLGLSPIPKAALRHNVWLMLVPSWPKYFGTRTFLDRNSVCHSWGWEAIERVTWHQGKAALQCHCPSTVTRKAAPFTAEPPSEKLPPKGSDRGRGLACPAVVDVLGHQTLLLDWGPSSPCAPPPPGSRCPEFGCNKGNTPLKRAL